MSIEQLFEEEPQVHDIDDLIQAVVVNKRALSISENRIVKEAISPGDMREGEAWSKKDEGHPAPRSRLKAGPQPIVRRVFATSVALHAAMAFIAKLFGRKALAGR